MMTTVKSVPEGQISLRQELLRKATHLFALTIPVGYYWLHLTRLEMLAAMVPITAAFVVVDIARLRAHPLWTRLFGRVFDGMIRGREVGGDFTGAVYILLTVCFVVALYSKPIAVAALAFIIVGDTLAALIGRSFGRTRLFDGKSLEGSLACLAGTVLVALAAPQLRLEVGLSGALVATVVEGIPSRVDDNVTVPVLSGLCMTILQRLLGTA